jgi:hypothetical protein
MGLLGNAAVPTEIISPRDQKNAKNIRIYRTVADMGPTLVAVYHPQCKFWHFTVIG